MFFLLKHSLMCCLQSGRRGKHHYHPSLNQHEWYRPSMAATNSSSSDSVDLASSGRLEARVGRSRIWKRILDHCFDNSDRRQYGMGVTGRVFGGRSMRSMRTTISHHTKHDVRQVTAALLSIKCIAPRRSNI